MIIFSRLRNIRYASEIYRFFRRRKNSTKKKAMAIAEVLKWNALPNVLAWKFPSEELSTKSQLIVAESQEAILVNQGVFVGPFAAGKHTLDTQNYPVLTRIVKAALGGRTPFSAEVWFIQKAFSLEVKWGTMNPVQVEDPKFHIFIPVRAFGQYSIKVSDSVKFMKKMVGTMPAFTVKTLDNYFKGIFLKHTIDLLAKYFAQRNISILQISANILDISDMLSSDISKELEDYGIKIVNFNVNSISTDENDPAVARLRRAMAERAEMEIMGFNYQQKRTFDTMEAAAANEGSGNAMNAGIGMAMGVGMGMPMGSIAGQMAQNLNPANIKPKFCSQCGAPVDTAAKFCSSCGAKIM